ncbi:NAD-dependent epimerase/dehydratase family protein [Streptomyces sp. NPDC052396]|uniref:NAD-dependent epimerase/dehydratase family protein n=1 Tax=Streptomyces sp. NPDC052396 TaxID=3365689 RepID=UPI0037D2FFDF
MPRAEGLTVVVLGATGYLGRRLCESFTGQGARVRPVSRGATGPEAVRLDVLTAWPEELARVLGSDGVDVVVNAAGRAWAADERQMAEGNARLVARITQALAGLDRAPRLVQLGSVHEYGAGTPGTATTEDQPAAPVTPYGRTKLQGSQEVLRAARESGVDGVVLRLANVVGAGAPAGSLFGKVADHLAEAARTRALGGTPAELRLPPLRTRRDLVDLADTVDAVLAAATAPADLVRGQVINVGGGRAVPMREPVDRMVALSGLPVPVAEAAPTPPLRADVEWQLLDITRARRLLGWRPRRTLDDSLRDLLAAAMPHAYGRTAP